MYIYSDRTVPSEIIDSIVALQGSVKILILGLDYQRYAKFRLLTPFVSKVSDGKYYIHRIQRSKGMDLTEEDIQFCIDFVIESAITLQEFEFGLERQIKD